MLHPAFAHPDTFVQRHIGPSSEEKQRMLDALGVDTLDELIRQTVPAHIRLQQPMHMAPALSEPELLAHMTELANKNRLYKSYIGTGYYDTIVPGVIQRNILENPGWYTQYTPYQAEIAQGRLEALLNFQTLVSDLTGLPVANASLLDEATAAAEAMSLAYAQRSNKQATTFLVSENLFPQTLALLETRAKPLGLSLEVVPTAQMQPSKAHFGLLLQYPAGDGTLEDYRALAEKAKAEGLVISVATDLLALLLLTPPGEWGADIAVGSAQRLGVPMGYGGPHAAFMATVDGFKRNLPGRIVGVSIDRNGKPALRLALQTREQHIRREKATSNICTAQVLLAIMNSMYAVYHGPQRLKAIAQRTHQLTGALAKGLSDLGYQVLNPAYFDTLRVALHPKTTREQVRSMMVQHGINLRYFEADNTLGISVDEAKSAADIQELLELLARAAGSHYPQPLAPASQQAIPGQLQRTSAYLTHPVFNSYHTETEMLRYIKRLEAKDLSLTTSMIPLGSCTMKLNATAEMVPVTFPQFGGLHPFAPKGQTEGYQEIFESLSELLCQATGFTGVSLQPNSGAQGEYAGLMAIRAYHTHRGDTHRNVALIPSSAHGTNPASAVMAGMQVVVTRVLENGNIDVEDLRRKATEHSHHLAALMVTYPSTNGVFEEAIQEICQIIHENGGLVYMDGANMNAQVGLTSPARIGADVCHLNLHKTFCIPHGGGGPGMGPICVNDKLKPFLPGHPIIPTGGDQAITAVSAAPWGSASILLISYAYIKMMGAEGLKLATEHAILNANYIKARLEAHYPVLYSGTQGRVAHELILDCRPFKQAADVEVEDIAKRLIDYGYHAPTVSFPVPGTLMIEPTESESQAELDKFIEAMIAIRGEMQEILDGEADKENNVLKNAPHTAEEATADSWTLPYSRSKAVYPAAWTRTHKFWPPVARVNNSHGDRNLICACPPMEAYLEPEALAGA
ncbi:MAG: aminomethyl-transferring glycine dehydrogenase [Bacteroidetes bacterium]|nr:aminomethyl-transferring glycine dehydrogenase [Bacteroidota bacterium]